MKLSSKPEITELWALWTHGKVPHFFVADLSPDVCLVIYCILCLVISLVRYYILILTYVREYFNIYNLKICISPIDIDIINVCSAQAVEEDEQTNDAGKDQHLEGYNV